MAAANPWRAKGRSRYSYFLEESVQTMRQVVSSDQPKGPDDSKQRCDLIIRDLVKVYSAQYAIRLLEQPNYLSTPRSKMEDYPLYGDECNNWLTSSANNNNRSRQSSNTNSIAGRRINGVSYYIFPYKYKEVNDNYISRPVISTYLFNTIAVPEGISRHQTYDSNSLVVTYDSIADAFGYGLDLSAKEEDYITRNFDFQRLRTLTYKSRVSHPVLGTHLLPHRYAYHSSSTPDYSVGPVDILLRHMMQSCLPMCHDAGNQEYMKCSTHGHRLIPQREVEDWRSALSENSNLLSSDLYSHIPLPSGLLIGAILHKAGSNPEYRDFILNHYFGVEAMDYLRSQSVKSKFSHPLVNAIFSGSSNEEISTLCNRDIIADLCGLVSGKSIINYVHTEKINYSELSIEAACGYRATLDGISYADVIPVFVSDTGQSKLDDYASKYGLTLQRCFKAFVQPPFAQRWAKHIRNGSLTRLDVSSLLCDYLSSFATLAAANGSLPLPLNTGSVWGIGSTSNGVYSCNLDSNIGNPSASGLTRPSIAEQNELYEQLACQGLNLYA